MLAAKLILEQGIEVLGLNFFTGFCVEGHTHAIRQRDRKRPKRNNALWVAEQLGIGLEIIDVVDEYKSVVLNPKHGYGAQMNPCLDCKIFMVNKALAWCDANDYDFIITGEVVGQRPMSQRKDTMPFIADRSGAQDRLLRPLCAQNLPPTYPERQGWIDREKLYGLHGRSRKPQIALAESFNLDYAQPAGGCCFLTDKNYTQKLKDLWSNRSERAYELDDIMLLKVGRHIRPNARYKIIIGREQGENNYLGGYRKTFTFIRPLSHPGAVSLIDGEPTAEDLHFAARLCARFSQAKGSEQVQMLITSASGVEHQLLVEPLPEQEVDPQWYL